MVQFFFFTTTTIIILVLRFFFFFCLCTGVSGYRWKSWGGSGYISPVSSAIAFSTASCAQKYFPLDGVTRLLGHLRQFSLFAVFQFLTAILYPKITLSQDQKFKASLDTLWVWHQPAIHAIFLVSKKTNNIKKKFKYLISLSAISSRPIHIITQNAPSLYG